MKWQDDKAALRSDEVRETDCKRCGARVYKALAGRVAALEVLADPTPLTERERDAERCEGRLVWCLHDSGFGAQRMQWSHWNCAHAQVREHICNRRDDSMDDLFDTTETLPSKPDVERDGYGRYLLPHPETGKRRAWQRTTTFTKMASDTFNLTQWQMRNVAKGIAARDDLRASVGPLDIRSDAQKLNELCEQAKEAAGGNAAANLGTALHTMTEGVDETGSYDDVSPEYVQRIRQYRAALVVNGISILPDMIERVIVNTTYEVGGKFDRVVKLADGTYAVFDLKTGRTLAYGQNEIAIQLAAYADGFNSHGVFDLERKVWTDPGFKVRTDIAIVAHLPADGDGCVLHSVDLESGRRGAQVCMQVRDYRKTKGAFSSYGEDEAGEERFLAAIGACDSHAELVDLAETARAGGVWNAVLGEACRKRAEEVAQ